LLEIRVPAAQGPVAPRDGGPQGNEPEPAQRLGDRSALGAAQALLREQLLPRDDRVVDAAARIAAEPAVSAGAEVVDQDVGVYEDADRCQARISLSKAASERLRERRRRMRRYCALSLSTPLPWSALPSRVPASVRRQQPPELPRAENIPPLLRSVATRSSSRLRCCFTGTSPATASPRCVITLSRWVPPTASRRRRAPV